MKTLTIIADDRVGLLADISYILGKAKINIENISVDVLGGKAIITLAVADRERAKSVLEAANYKVSDVESIVIKLPDKPGELSRITNVLAKDGINITNVHMITKDGKNTVIALIVDKPRKAEVLLKDFLLAAEEIY